MFSKTKDNGSSAPETVPTQQMRRTANRPAAPSIISSDMHVIGTITCTGDIQIDGKIEGDIYSTYLTVGEKAIISGEIRSDEVIIRGHVMGGIRARKVNLASTCHVEGDIMHNALAVETGAFFQGNIKHADDPLSDALNEDGSFNIKGSAGVQAQQNSTSGSGSSSHQPPQRTASPVQQAAAAPAQVSQRPPAPQVTAQPSPSSAAPQAAPSAPQTHHQGTTIHQQPSPTQQAAQAATQRSRQTFAQFNPAHAGGGAQAEQRMAPRADDANEAVTATLEKLSAAQPSPPPRPTPQPRVGQPTIPGTNGRFPPNQDQN